MADRSRDISAVLRIREASAPLDAEKSDTFSGLDGTRPDAPAPEVISTIDRNGAGNTEPPIAGLQANASSHVPSNSDTPSNPDPSNNDPSNGVPSGAAAGDAGPLSDARVVADTSHREAAPSPTEAGRVTTNPAPIAENPALSAAPVRPPDQPPSAPPAPRSRGNRLVGVLAVVSILAAGISLTAPALRPELERIANEWFGADNPITAWLLPPHPPNDMERDLAALLPRVAQLEAGLRGVSGELRRLDSRLAEAGSTLHEGLGSIDSIARMAQDALRRTEGIEAASQDLTNRIRAASLLALATRLRRDIDVGAPLAESALLLALYGPYPPAVERAIEDLTRIPDGAPTMRDLAAGFEVLETRIQAVAGLDSSWSARSWNRVRSLFGAAPTDLETAIGERLHALAGEGRFMEAADLLERSPWKELGAAWIGQVRDRASAGRAAQLVMAHAVAITRATQAVTQAATQGSAQQQGTRPQAPPQQPPSPSSAPAASGRKTP